ncbi:GTPase HflX [Candidatus Bathyarchaeota archaeon]|nr:GTPase HflX [Candidatus Bathyarchaeota archaeon]
MKSTKVYGRGELKVRVNRSLDREVGVGRAVLCMLKTNIHDHGVYRIKLKELRSLVESLGIEVVGEFVQTERSPSARYYIGSGKVKELRKFVEDNGVDMVIFYNLLSSSQKLNLIRALGREVLDRYEITLAIFERRASDNLSKLQIEAARLNKIVPYLKLQASLKYRNERPFFLSMGEYAYHSQLREITRRQARIRERIEALRKEKIEQIAYRKGQGFPIVCISGYYNAGKTSLFNALTGEKKEVSPLPFTTLTSKYQRRYLEPGLAVLFIDTIGFVLDLDPRLIKSFELNLEDMRNADLVLLLLEITDPILVLKMKIREGIKLLTEIGVQRERIIIVLNKIDLAGSSPESICEALEIERYGLPWIMISADKRINLEGLLQLITERLIQLDEKTGGFMENAFRSPQEDHATISPQEKP